MAAPGPTSDPSDPSCTGSCASQRLREHSDHDHERAQQDEFDRITHQGPQHSRSPFASTRAHNVLVLFSCQTGLQTIAPELVLSSPGASNITSKVPARLRSRERQPAEPLACASGQAWNSEKSACRRSSSSRRERQGTPRSPSCPSAFGANPRHSAPLPSPNAALRIWWRSVSSIILFIHHPTRRAPGERPLAVRVLPHPYGKLGALSHLSAGGQVCRIRSHPHVRQRAGGRRRAATPEGDAGWPTTSRGPVC